MATASAQELSNLRVKWIAVSEDTLQIDTLSIIPGTVEMQEAGQSALIAEEDYRLDCVTARLYWLLSPSSDSVLLKYRVLPINLLESSFHKDESDLTDIAGRPLTKVLYKPNSVADDLFDLGGLDYNGSFARGISLGNSQDLSVNSSFNMQMSGMISEDVEILASITDNNIPFQAQGNTQQLQEFDRIFIQLTKGNHQLIVGDYDLPRPETHFLNYKKKLQGASISSFQDDVLGGRVSGKASVAVARGRYNRMTFQAEEGNQGPYKLRGANGETFIIILSGSERVFIDGKEMIRGQQNDYIIDYNLGELSFTPRQLITKDKRIVVEFEYSQRNYLRSLYQAEAAYEQEKWNVNVHFLSEQDAKNQSGLQDLSGDQKLYLSEIGDNIDQSFVTGVDSVGFVENQVLYELMDTTIAGETTSIYRYSTEPEVAVYSLRFSNVGPSGGNYILSSSSVNGRIYEWVAPDPLTGEPTGNYSPLTQLVPPRKQQLLTIGGEIRPISNMKLQAEIAMSNNDVNTFSDLDAENDRSSAFFLAGEQLINLNQDNGLDLALTGSFENVDNNFRFVEQYRNVEFRRDWNSNVQQGTYQEQLAYAGVELRKKEYGRMSYRFGTFRQDGFYRGDRNELRISADRNGWSLNSGANYLSSNGNEEDSRYWRADFLLKKVISESKWETGVRSLSEDNRLSLDTFTDSLSIRSFAFHEVEVFMRMPVEARNRFGVSAKLRDDLLPKENDLSTVTRAMEVQVDGAISENPRSQLLWNVNFRDLQVQDTSRTSERARQTILGELQYIFAAWKGLLKSSSWYQLGSGQQQKIEYFFRPVQANLGDFIWRDNNDNGIQEIEEFEMASVNSLEDSIRYIRETIPTGEFEPTKVVAFNQSLQIQPKALWKNKEGIRGWIARLSLQSNWQFKRQFVNDGSYNAYAPFLLPVDESILFSTNASSRNTLYINRSGSKFRSEIYYNLFSQKVLLTAGTDGSDRKELGAKNRFFLNRQLSASLDGLLLDSENSSEAFESRQYDLEGFLVEPSIRYQKGGDFNLEFSYRYRQLENQIDLQEKGIENSLNLRARYNVVTKRQLSGRFSWVAIDYGDFPTNTTVAFQILDGLQPGRNFVWELNLRNQFANNVQLNISYNGKKSEDSRIVHVGRMELRAVF